MTRTTNARLAGFIFLFYIATGVADMVLFGQATAAEGTAATLASVAQHASLVRVILVLRLLTSFNALVLAVALYALTRDQDPDLAVLALCCRASEGVITVISIVWTRGLLSVATATTGAAAPDAAAANALGALLLKGEASGSSPQRASPWAARFTPTSSCVPEASPSRWPGWAYSPRSSSWWPFPCSSPDSSRAR